MNNSTGKELLRRCVRLGNHDGLNLRVAVLLSERARSFPCEIRVRCQERCADARNILDLLCLIAGPGCEVLLEAQGPEGQKALASLESLLVPCPPC